MDLHEFSGGDMYFNESISEEALAHITVAASLYPDAKAETSLLKAFALEPSSLTVLVALYRFYYYQHRYQDALDTAIKSMSIVGKRLGFKGSWQSINMSVIGYGVMKSMTLVRFYLLSLKGSAFMNIRLGNIDTGIAMLEKVASVDSQDRLGVCDLLRVVENYQRRSDANFGRLSLASSNY